METGTIMDIIDNNNICLFHSQPTLHPSSQEHSRRNNKRGRQ